VGKSEGHVYRYREFVVAGKSGVLGRQIRIRAGDVVGKKYDDALSQYQYILDANKKISAPAALDVKLAISDIYAWKLEYDRAIDYVVKLTETYPGNVDVINCIAKIYLWKKEISKSKEYTQRALSIDANDSEAVERMKELDQIKPFAVSLGYEYAWYDSKNYKGDHVVSHSSMAGLNWQYSVPLRVFSYVTGIVQNSIESRDQENSAKWHNDTNLRAGGIYRINDATFTSAAVDYTYDAEIFPDFSAEFSLRRKLTQHIDVIGLYKFTYDKLDSAQTISSKKYNLFSPGFIFYYNPEIYNKIQFYAETDGKDFSYSVFVNQHVAVDPENIFQLYLFLSQGRAISCSPTRPCGRR
jgi:tetratricopeptide (TPR) repeat protein